MKTINIKSLTCQKVNKTLFETYSEDFLYKEWGYNTLSYIYHEISCETYLNIANDLRMNSVRIDIHSFLSECIAKKIIEIFNTDTVLALIENVLSTKNHPCIKYFFNIQNQIIEDII